MVAYRQTDGHKWHVLRTKPKKERLVAAQMRLRGVDVYLPMYPSHAGNGKALVRERAFFPGYLFVHADLDQLGNSALSWIPGLNGLVQFGGRPAVIAEHLMISLRARLASAMQANTGEDLGLKKGDVVRVKHGIFTGYSAIFDAHLPDRKRVRILLKLLRSCGHGDGRCLPLELAADDIRQRHGRRRGRRRH